MTIFLLIVSSLLPRLLHNSHWKKSFDIFRSRQIALKGSHGNIRKHVVSKAFMFLLLELFSSVKVSGKSLTFMITFQAGAAKTYQKICIKLWERIFFVHQKWICITFSCRQIHKKLDCSQVHWIISTSMQSHLTFCCEQSIDVIDLLLILWLFCLPSYLLQQVHSTIDAHQLIAEWIWMLWKNLLITAQGLFISNLDSRPETM